MTVVFYILGSVVMAAGGLWVFLTIANAARSSNQMASVAALIVAAPGFSVMFGGLLLLAIGAVLARLDRIATNTARTSTGGYFQGDTSRWSAADRERNESLRQGREPRL